jgi:hypothetical protein
MEVYPFAITFTQEATKCAASRVPCADKLRPSF